MAVRADIAGKGLADPLAQILSVEMMLRYAFDIDREQPIRSLQR